MPTYLGNRFDAQGWGCAGRQAGSRVQTGSGSRVRRGSLIYNPLYLTQLPSTPPWYVPAHIRGVQQPLPSLLGRNEVDRFCPGSKVTSRPVISGYPAAIHRLAYFVAHYEHPDFTQTSPAACALANVNGCTLARKNVDISSRIDARQKDKYTIRKCKSFARTVRYREVCRKVGISGLILNAELDTRTVRRYGKSCDFGFGVSCKSIAPDISRRIVSKYGGLICIRLENTPSHLRLTRSDTVQERCVDISRRINPKYRA